MATSFNIDATMDRTLEELKKHYGATSKAEVMRKAVALLKVASQHENNDGSLTLRQDGQGDIKVVVR